MYDFNKYNQQVMRRLMYGLLQRKLNLLEHLFKNFLRNKFAMTSLRRCDFSSTLN